MSKAPNSKLFDTATQYRSFQVIETRADDGETPVKRGILATEAPVMMPDWERMEMIPEVLCIDGCKVRGNTLKLVDSHNTGSVRNVLGSYRDIKKRGATKDTPFAHIDGVPDISKAEPDIRMKFEEGHINEMSVGYDIEPKRSKFVPEGETYEYKGRTFAGPVNVREVWYAKEASLVPLGADDLAQARGFKSMRDAMGATTANETDKQPEVDALENVVDTSERISPPNQETETMSDPITTTDSAASPPPARSTATTNTGSDTSLAAERARANAIADLADSYGCREDGRKAIAEGMPTEQFVSQLRGKIRKSEPTQSDPIPWSQRDAKRWSLGRAAQLLADGKQVDGIEGEVTQEIARRTGKSTRGFFLPSQHDIAQFGRSDSDVTLKAGTATDGAELVPTRTATDRYIPFFTPRPVMWDLGATVITGVTENFNVPVESSTATAFARAEDTAHYEQQPQFATVSFTPHSYGFFTEVTKRLLYQSPAAVEQILRTIMERQMSIAFDADGQDGSGSGECDGIISHASAATVTITTAGTVTFDNVLEFESDVETANALENNCAYLTTPAIKKLWKKTAEYGTDRNPIWTNQMMGTGNSQGMVNGYKAVSSNQSPSNSVIFGDFSYYWYVIFDGVEITVTEDADLAKRRAVQFCCNVDLDGKPVKGQAFSHNV